MESIDLMLLPQSPLYTLFCGVQLKSGFNGQANTTQSGVRSKFFQIVRLTVWTRPIRIGQNGLATESALKG